ncbi:glycosyltransferase family 2 protein [Citrifermentans bremense]|uniref:glycosyltransferase family 2 protein n=1 Tax=Citrifermentans bremense TaxID=60035 RepID=UPI0005575059|nr:glycosyltransferase family 2 protein [Citrifermentans bremense]
MVWTQMLMIALLLLLGYLYLGYPALLCLLARLFPKAHRFDEGYTPTVTLVISAYNEVEVIRSKIENSFALDYPADKLSIMVVSDCSDDGTDEAVLEYACRGVRLVRASLRRGKTSALNQAMALVESEVVVFSDANAIYDKNAIRKLVRHFSDQAIGYVVGYARYLEETRTAAGTSEGAYWNVEVLIKKWESDFSSVVGGDGAIYAIRRFLYQPMQESDINDFVNPLQIVVKGFRGIFDPEAYCFEQPAGKFEKEFSRKVRIVNRSFNALYRVPEACNPLRTGRFAWLLVSHKLLRWFSPYLLLLFLCALLLDWGRDTGSLLHLTAAALTGLLFLLAGVGKLLDGKGKSFALFHLPYYFLLINHASARGILLRLRGTTITTWNTVRQGDAVPAAGGRWVPRLLVFTSFAVLAVFACGMFSDPQRLALAAWLLAFALAHAFVIYPGLLLPLARLHRIKVTSDGSYSPEVTLLILALNEEAVIESKVLNSLALDYPKEKLRIVVASDGSTDRTNAIVAGYAALGVELFAYPSNRGKIAALNDAMREIGSEIVLFSDANVNYHPQAVKNIVRNFADPRVGAVSGKVMLSSGTLSYGVAERAYYSIEHSIQKHEGAAGVLIGGDGAMFAIRRSLFNAPPADTILDDLVIALGIARQGHLVVHEKEALGFEENLLEFRREFRRKARIIAGGYQCLLRGEVLPRWDQPLLMFCFLSHKVLRWGSGILFLALMGVLLQIQFLHDAAFLPRFRWLLALMVSSVLLALLAQFCPRIQRLKVANLCHYFCMLLVASLVGCYLGVTGKQQVTWRREAA